MSGSTRMPYSHREPYGMLEMTRLSSRVPTNGHLARPKLLPSERRNGNPGAAARIAVSGILYERATQ